MSALTLLQKEFRAQADPEKARVFLRFFKTGPGQYGEGDRFAGVIVPKLRVLARRHYGSLSLAEAGKLITSGVHEERLLALLILVLKFQKGTEKERADVYRLYCRSTRWINNWDLVDTSAAYIVGPYLEGRSRAQLHRWSKSKDLWERRIAVLSTFFYIKQSRFEDFMKIAERLLKDEEDLIHKAVGWMLREVGKRDRLAEMKFLDRHSKRMPRTMLRYALEHFPERMKRAYMAR